MAKNGSIKHYRQAGTARAPASLPFGEIAIAKDGTIFAGNESGVPVEAGAVTGVKGASESAYRTGQVNLTAANLGAATAAQGTKADNAMPKSGGTFTGDVAAHSANRYGSVLRNIDVKINGPDSDRVSTSHIIMVRK